MTTKSHNRKSGARHGFTLIEVLVAMTISGILLASIGGVFFTAVRLRNSMTERLDEALPIEDALATMRHDLAGIVGSSSTNGVFIGPLKTINQTNTLNDQIGPDFYTEIGHLDGMVPWGDIAKVDYLLSTSTNRLSTGRDLVRAVTHNLLPVNAPGEPDDKQVLLSGVQSLIFTYYDNTAWQNAWDTTQQTNLPTAIKVQIQMAPHNYRGAMATGNMYELVVPLDIQVSTNLTTALP